MAESATAGTRADYNVVDSRSGGTPYVWAGTGYAGQPEFTAATGQGAHDFVALTTPFHGEDIPASHLTDSADENAPGMLRTDRRGGAPVDDPTVPNTGTGSGTRDRGAVEYTAVGSAFTTAGPARLLDTREAVGVPSAQAVPAYGTIDLPVTGVAGIPASGVTAVTMNVTAVDPGQGGHLTVHPHGDAAPTASNLNWTAGRTVANLVTVPVKDGKVSFHNHSGGTVHLIADLAGYFGTEGRLAFHPGGPRRLMDTRVGQGSPNSHPAAPVPAWGTLAVIPAYGSYPPGVTLNVTVTEPGAEGHLTVYPQGGPVPGTSNLNFLRGETISNQVVVRTGGDTVLFHNASDAPVHLVVDYYGAERY